MKKKELSPTRKEERDNDKMGLFLVAGAKKLTPPTLLQEGRERDFSSNERKKGPTCSNEGEGRDFSLRKGKKVLDEVESETMFLEGGTLSSITFTTTKETHEQVVGVVKGTTKSQWVIDKVGKGITNPAC